MNAKVAATQEACKQEGAADNKIARTAHNGAVRGWRTVGAASAEVSSTGRSVLIRLGRECLQIPTQQLTVHYMRDLGETSKIVRRIEGAPAPSAAAATAPALAVV